MLQDYIIPSLLVVLIRVMEIVHGVVQGNRRPDRDSERVVTEDERNLTGAGRCDVTEAECAIWRDRGSGKM